MLLIVGSDDDPNARRLVDQLYIKNLNYIQIDPSKRALTTLKWRLGEDQLLLNGDALHPKAVYMRHNVFSADSELWSLALVRTVTSFILGNPSVRVMNRKSLLHDNNKTANLLLAESLGLKVPETEVYAGPPSCLKQEFEGQDVIAKPLEGGDYASLPSDIDEASVSYAAAFVQSRLPGENYRVFVIDGKAYGFSVQSALLDYRVDPETKGVSVPLTPDIIQGSIALAARCGFDYCALDFRADADGTWVFLEINSFPMFVAFDDASDNALVNAQLAFLLSGSAD